MRALSSSMARPHQLAPQQMKPLPEFLETLISSPPAAGSGVHNWMFSVSRNLHAHLPAGEIENLIRSRLVNCGRAVPDREIKDAVKRSIDFAWQPKGDAGNTSTTNPSPLQQLSAAVIQAQRLRRPFACKIDAAR